MGISFQKIWKNALQETITYCIPLGEKEDLQKCRLVGDMSVFSGYVVGSKSQQHRITTSSAVERIWDPPKFETSDTPTFWDLFSW